MNQDNRNRFKVIARVLGWLLVVAHPTVLLFAFYCILNAERMSDLGDPADTAFHAGLIRNIMWGLVIVTVISSGLFFLIRKVLERKVERWERLVREQEK